MKVEKALRREKQQHKARTGMRVRNASVRVIQRALAARAQGKR